MNNDITHNHCIENTLTLLCDIKSDIKHIILNENNTEKQITHSHIIDETIGEENKNKNKNENKNECEKGDEEENIILCETPPNDIRKISFMSPSAVGHENGGTFYENVFDISAHRTHRRKNNNHKKKNNKIQSYNPIMTNNLPNEREPINVDIDDFLHSVYSADNAETEKEIHKKTVQKRVVTQHKKWTFQPDDYSPDTQIKLIKSIHKYLLGSPQSLFSHISSDETDVGEPDNEKRRKMCNGVNKKETVVLQELNKKLYGYKSQDIEKKIYNPTDFIDILFSVQLLIDSNLLCYYCKTNVNVLYENKREPTQWSLERINNNYGHNKTNVVISCLKCNLRRRTMMVQRYVSTQEMKIVRKI